MSGGTIPSTKTYRAFYNGEQRVCVEHDPWIMMRPLDGGRLVMSYYTLERPRHIILPWPDDVASSDGMTTFYEGATNALIRSYIRDNIAALRSDLALGECLEPFPRGDRIAIVGKGPTAEHWHKGEPLPLGDELKGWAPNLTIYCNHAGARKRPLASNAAQNWIAVIDRDVTAAEMAPAFDGADGVLFSIGVKPELLADAARRGLAIHMMAPHQYREDITKGRIGLTHRVTFCAHMGGVASTAASAVYQNRQQGSVLVTGVCGAYPIPVRDDPAYDKELERAYLYNDMAVVMAGVTGYLNARGLKVWDLASIYGEKVTPFGYAKRALQHWDAMQSAWRASKMQGQRDRLADEVAKFPAALAAAGVKAGETQP